MRFFFPIILVAFLPLSFALSEYDYLAVLKNFADSLIAPRSAEVAASINSCVHLRCKQGSRLTQVFGRQDPLLGRCSGHD